MKKILISLLATITLLSAAFNDVATDYSKTTSSMYNEGSQDLFLHNLFLGFVQQCRPDLMLNTGYFSATLKSLELNQDFEVIAKVYRDEGDSAPMYIDLWFNLNGIVYAQFKVDEAPSDLYPYGVWSFNFANHSGTWKGVAKSTKDGSKQRLEYDESGEEPVTLTILLDNITKSGTSLKNNTNVNFNNRYQDYNDTHYAQFDEIAGYKIWEYALFDVNGSKVSLTTSVNAEFTKNDVQYYLHGTDAKITISNYATFEDENVSTGDFDGQLVTDFNNNQYTIVASGEGDTRKLFKDNNQVEYSDSLTLTDANGDSTSTFDGDWLSTELVYENGSSFTDQNDKKYYIKQVSGQRLLEKVLKSTVAEAERPTTTVIETSTLTPEDVKSLIGEIPTAVTYKLRYGKEVK